MSEQAPTSLLTSKHHVTLPEPVLKALGLEVGDTVAFDILPEHQVHLRRAESDSGKLAGTEPLSNADDQSFRNL